MKISNTDENAVIKFLEDHKKMGHLMICHYLILLDGSFWPPSTPIDVLLTAAEHIGVAGFVSFAQSGKDRITQLDRLWVHTPDAAHALMLANDALKPDSVICTEPSATVN
jgi:hypothetical protein